MICLWLGMAVFDRVTNFIGQGQTDLPARIHHEFAPQAGGGWTQEGSFCLPWRVENFFLSQKPLAISYLTDLEIWLYG
ncbi:MAG: hypothetical protein BM558_03255 [Roseobacter sp. MedPE-SW]|nr:MAG: hypothetical protein BM558_03255 [Roseobacter sp. MedPE-SW]